MLFAASFPKYGSPAFAWIAIAPLIVACALAANTPRGRTLPLGLISGIVGFLGTLYWVSLVVQQYGGLSTWVAAIVGILTAMYLGIFPGIFAWLLGRSIRRFGVAGVWLAPFLWVASEWLRASVGLRFPWALLGASQATVLPVAQLASVTGVYGLSFLVALVSAAAAALALSRAPMHRRGAFLVAALLLIVTATGAWRLSRPTLTQEGQPFRVGLVQGNVGQQDKYDPRFRDAIIQRYVDLSRQAIAGGAQLVMWPEASTPFYFDLNAVLAAPIRRLAVESRTPFIIGTDQFQPAQAGEPDRYFNSAVMLGADGRSRASYQKMNLVPFGEFVPMKRLLFFVGPLVEAVSDFSPGQQAVVFDADGPRVSVAICYEIVDPTLARAFVDRGSQLLATITNDAWFGTTSAAYQHFDQAGLRAIEEGRYVVRAANTGISGAIDPYGRVLRRTDLFLPASLTVDVRLLSSRTIYSRVGDVVAWIALVIAAALALPTHWIGPRRPRQPAISMAA